MVEVYGGLMVTGRAYCYAWLLVALGRAYQRGPSHPWPLVHLHRPLPYHTTGQALRKRVKAWREVLREANIAYYNALFPTVSTASPALTPASRPTKGTRSSGVASACDGTPHAQHFQGLSAKATALEQELASRSRADPRADGAGGQRGEDEASSLDPESGLTLPVIVGIVAGVLGQHPFLNRISPAYASCNVYVKRTQITIYRPSTPTHVVMKTACGV